MVNFDDLPLIPHTRILQACGVSDTYGKNQLQKSIHAGIVKRPHRTITGRVMLTVDDARAFYTLLGGA